MFVPYKPLHPRPIFATEATAYLSGATTSKRAMSFRRKAFVRQIFSLHNISSPRLYFMCRPNDSRQKVFRPKDMDQNRALPCKYWSWLKMLIFDKHTSLSQEGVSLTFSVIRYYMIFGCWTSQHTSNCV